MIQFFRAISKVIKLTSKCPGPIKDIFWFVEACANSVDAKYTVAFVAGEGRRRKIRRGRAHAQGEKRREMRRKCVLEISPFDLKKLAPASQAKDMEILAN